MGRERHQLDSNLKNDMVGKRKLQKKTQQLIRYDDIKKNKSVNGTIYETTNCKNNIHHEINNKY